MKYKIDFNNGLGFLPVSLFIEIDEKIQIFGLWDNIQDTRCRDIIFHGTYENIKNNLQELSFINSRLIANMFQASIILPVVDEILFTELTSTRLIVFFKSDTKNSTYYKHNVKLLSYLSENDIIILDSTSLKEFLFTRQFFIENKIKAKVLLQNDAVSKQDMLDNKIYDVYPYGELNV